MVDMTIAKALSQAGLEHLVDAFSEISFQRFKSLLIQDYEKFGVYDVHDKQTLFRLIQSISGKPSNKAVYDETHNAPDALMDLEADDTDFLTDDLDLDGFAETNLADSPVRNNGYIGAVHSATDSEPELFSAPDPPKIRVIVRKRPLNKKELERGDADVLECDQSASTLFVNEPKLKVDLTRFTERHSFRFDDVFDEFVCNDELYDLAIRPLIATIFRSGKATCFAYGQTGSGKTYTMAPLAPRAAKDIFGVLARPDHQHARLWVSCYEIYGGKLFDLLGQRAKLEVREDAKKRVQVVGLKEVEVGEPSLLKDLCDTAAAAPP
ncbi:kinesin, partial [Helicosporidium sp. ATCC 50920]